MIQSDGVTMKNGDTGSAFYRGELVTLPTRPGQETSLSLSDQKVVQGPMENRKGSVRREVLVHGPAYIGVGSAVVVDEYDPPRKDLGYIKLQVLSDIWIMMGSVYDQNADPIWYDRGRLFREGDQDETYVCYVMAQNCIYIR
jgi:hypothetical protein